MPKKSIRKLSNIVLAVIGIGILFSVYLFAGPLILEGYCDPRAKEAAKGYSELLINPPQDLIEAYKDHPEIIDANSQPTPYYVEFLRCKLKLSEQLYPFLHIK